MADEESPKTPRRRRSARARSADTGGEKAAPSDEARGTEAASTEDTAQDAAEEDTGKDTAREANGKDSGGRGTGGARGDADAADAGGDEPAGHRPGGSIVRVARRAAEHVGALTGRHPETVISIEPRDGKWCVGVEVVEARRIPDSADILAIYEVLVRPDGELLSYRRVRRYTRGQVDRPWR
jgi:hypothetical protein